ncbi:MAG: hypothetical protein JWS12_545 [Candidatus Saccharibacteria bacterium]|nr:hypothetical protein [Candidatus Saccharibacteria bacterium]
MLVGATGCLSSHFILLFVLMTDLEGVIKGPEQQAGEYWQKASGIIKDHPELLEHRTSIDGETHLLITPSFSPAQRTIYKSHKGGGSLSPLLVVKEIKGKTRSETEIYSQSYAIAAQVNKDWCYKPGMPLLLVINDNTANAQIKFNFFGDGLVRLDNSFAGIDDNNAVGKILDYIDECMDAKQEREENKRHNRHVRRWLAGGMVATLLGTGGLAGNILVNKRDATLRRAEAARAFDASNVQVPGNGPAADTAIFVKSDGSFFSQAIPDVQNGETFVHPRVIHVDEGICYGALAVNPLTEAVRLVTDAPAESIVATRGSNGDIQLCAENDSDPSTLTSYKVAAQVVNNG